MAENPRTVAPGCRPVGRWLTGSRSIRRGKRHDRSVDPCNAGAKFDDSPYSNTASRGTAQKIIGVPDSRRRAASRETRSRSRAAALYGRSKVRKVISKLAR